MASSMLGFDIGSSSVKIVLWDGKKITRAIAAETPDNLVKNGVIVSYEAMADFIKETLKENKLKAKNCAIVLPSNFSFLRRITMPAMTIDQLKVNLPYEFRDFLTQGKDKYFYDYSVCEIRNGEDGKPKEMDIIAAAVEKSIIDNYRDMFHRTGLKLCTAVPVEGVYANLISRLENSKDREFAFLNLGHAVTRLDIFTGSRFETSRLSDIGLDALDRAIADENGVDTHIANTYKQSDHLGVQTSESAMNIYAAIATDVRKAINFYNFNSQQSNLKEIWCCGGGASIPALCNTITEATGLPVLSIETILPPIDSDIKNASLFAAVIGAAIQ